MPVIPEAPIAVQSAPAKTLEPVYVKDRIRTAARVGTWTGAVLGLVAFVIAASSWSETASVSGADQLSPILISDSRNLLIGVALVSVVFGAVVASLARAAASWANPSMQLSSSKASTAWIGGSLGLVLGVVAGAVLGSGFGTPIEGSEGLVQLPVISTLLVMVIGGALLGSLTTLATQFFAVPVAVADEDRAEISAVKRRLGGAIGIPLAGLVMLLLLVLPFAITLIESNHLTSGGAAIIAILAAGGVLAFASLAGTKPNMRISFGEFLVALAGIGAIILLVFAILNNTGGSEENPESSATQRVVAISTVHA
jgi:MFS family permease